MIAFKIDEPIIDNGQFQTEFDHIVAEYAFYKIHLQMTLHYTLNEETFRKGLPSLIETLRSELN